MSESPHLVRQIVYVDTTSVMTLGFTTGIQRVVRELVPRLFRRPDVDLRMLRFDSKTATWQELETRSALANLADAVSVPQVARLLPVEQWEQSAIFLDIDATWNHQLRRSTLFPLLAARGLRIVSFLYDLGPLRLPQFAEGRTTANFTVWLAAVMTWADLVVADSHDAERDFLDYCRRSGLRRHVPTLVTRLGADLPRLTQAGAEELTDLPFLDDPYLLFVGTIEPRKRQLLALEAWDLLARDRDDLHLVFAGRKGWMVDDALERLEGHPQFGRRVHWVQGPSDAVLSTLYERATLCLYLSRLEGYGLPVAEALGHGRITLASRIGSIYEVAREACDYTWFDTAPEVAETVATYLDDPVLRDRREQYIAGFRPLSWDLVAATLGEAVLGLASHRPANGESPGAPRELSYDGTLLGRPDRAGALAELDGRGAEVLHYLSGPHDTAVDDVALNLAVTRNPTGFVKVPVVTDATAPGPDPRRVADVVAANGLAHGLLRFDDEDLTVLVGGVPQLVVVEPGGVVGLDLAVHTMSATPRPVQVRLGDAVVDLEATPGYAVGRHALALPAQPAEITELDLRVDVDGRAVDLDGRRYVVVVLTTDDLQRSLRRLRRRS